ncbi:hypothetical protein, partial [Phascolarctobacterium faecium]|uniref:phosphoketolase family protein n=1 Tax=Phascolarctobacterium faecium TaxID=33025 RepID=UPI003AAA5DEE
SLRACIQGKKPYYSCGICLPCKFLRDTYLSAYLKYGLASSTAHQLMQDKLVEHKQYIAEYGLDMPEIRDWKWDI